MDTSLSDDRKALLEEQRQLIEKARQLKCELANIAEEPEVKQLLEERNKFENIKRELCGSANYIQCFIENSPHLVESLRDSLENKKSSRSLDKEILILKSRIEHIKKSKLPHADMIVVNYFTMIREMNSLPRIVKANLFNNNAQREFCLQKIKETLKEINDFLLRVDQCLDQIREELKDTIRQIEGRIDFNNRVIQQMNEAHQDRKNNILANSSLACSSLQQPAVVSKRRKKKLIANLPAKEKGGLVDATGKQWVVVVVDNENKVAKAPLSESSQCIDMFKRTFFKDSIRNSVIENIYEKVLTAANSPRRHLMQRAKGKMFGKSIKCKVGKYRVLLLFDNINTEIYVTIGLRKEIYGGH